MSARHTELLVRTSFAIGHNLLSRLHNFAIVKKTDNYQETLCLKM